MEILEYMYLDSTTTHSDTYRNISTLEHKREGKNTPFLVSSKITCLVTQLTLPTHTPRLLNPLDVDTKLRPVLCPLFVPGFSISVWVCVLWWHFRSPLLHRGEHSSLFKSPVRSEAPNTPTVCGWWPQLLDSALWLPKLRCCTVAGTMAGRPTATISLSPTTPSTWYSVLWRFSFLQLKDRHW